MQWRVRPNVRVAIDRYQESRVGQPLEVLTGRPPSRAGSLPHGIRDDCRIWIHHRSPVGAGLLAKRPAHSRSEEHTSELQSLMRISYAVFCLNKKNSNTS